MTSGHIIYLLTHDRVVIFRSLRCWHVWLWWGASRTFFFYENLVSTTCEFSQKCETCMQEF